jgi:hypothetical protein
MPSPTWTFYLTCPGRDKCLRFVALCLLSSARETFNFHDSNRSSARESTVIGPPFCSRLLQTKRTRRRSYDSCVGSFRRRSKWQPVPARGFRLGGTDGHVRAQAPATRLRARLVIARCFARCTFVGVALNFVGDRCVGAAVRYLTRWSQASNRFYATARGSVQVLGPGVRSRSRRMSSPMSDLTHHMLFVRLPFGR